MQQKKIFCGLILVLLVTALPAQNSDPHPRLLIHAEESKRMIDRLKTEPYKGWLDLLINRVEGVEEPFTSADYNGDTGPELAFLYWVTNDPKWAEQAYEKAIQIANDSVFLSLHTFGLSRAQMLKNLALTYDFAYEGWTIPQRQTVADALYQGMIRINASMGPAANYNIDSNWMGIRFGAVILAALVWDNLASDENKIAKAFLWDATKRLREHLERNFHQEGWNGESLGYFQYAWTSVGPALIALQNSHRKTDAFHLQKFAPHVLNALKGVAISNVSIEAVGGTGMKPDLSDDNLFMSPVMLYAQGFRLFPEHQHPAIRWAFDYIVSPQNLMRSRGGLLYALLYYPSQEKSANPRALHWDTFLDRHKGILVSRNHFEDKNDIVVVHNVSENRVRGHAGPDVNTIRLIGLEVPWIIGGGRTGEVPGQSNFFSAEVMRAEERGTRGKLVAADISVDPRYSVAFGSDMRIQNLKRTVYASFDARFGAAAVVVVTDSSENGARWRINTPEFNQLTRHDQGYVLTAPNGNTMRVQAVGPSIKGIEYGLLPYGGSTVRHNPFIRYKGKVYEKSRWIDLLTGPQVMVVITLATKGEEHPEIKWDRGRLSINNQVFNLMTDQ